jgi:hypothetical protein
MLIKRFRIRILSMKFLTFLCLIDDININKYNYSTIKDSFYCNLYNEQSLCIILWNIAAQSLNLIPEVIQHFSIFRGHRE